MSGLLFNNNLVMYDRRDEEDPQSLYPQMTRAAITGPRTGDSLRLLPSLETTWGYWRKLYPGTTVLSDETGVYSALTYKNYPYGMYRLPGTLPFYHLAPPLDANPIGRVHDIKAVTLGLRFGDRTKAYPLSAMSPEAVINDQVAGNQVLVVCYAKAHLAIAYDRTVLVDTGSHTLTFDRTPSDDPVYPFLLRDRETGSRWNLKGWAVEGELRGARLRQLPAHNAYWFAWATFWQDSEIQ
ncbi:MAG: DUF3179 domain-containing (seleno)protein [Candidatus Latescibacteria bacterium]|nr:DUF3179 domain-containing (seleno)protein [Candidatus Latescibacterota bacterium]